MPTNTTIGFGIERSDLPWIAAALAAIVFFGYLLLHAA